MNEVEIHITVDDSDVDPSLAALKGKFARAFADFPTLSLFDFKTGQIDSHLSMIKTKLQAHGIADLLDVNLNPGQIDAQLLNLKRKIQQHKLSDFLDVNLDVGQAESQMLALMEELGNFSVSIPVSLDIDKSALAALHSLQGITVGVGTGGFRDDCCTEIVNAINQNADMVSHDLAGVQDILAAGFQRVTNAIHDNGDLISHDLQALVAMGRGGGGGGSSAAAAAGGAAGGGFGFRGWGWLFAGTSFAGIAAWHIAFDTLLETFIAVTGAAAAMAAGIAATIPTFDQLGIHMKAINSVNSAFGDQINVSGGAFRNFAESSGVANRALEIFGGGVSIVQKNTGGLIDVADKVLTLLDDWVAKIDLWANSQGGLNKFLHDGIGYLDQFGQIFGNIGVGISHLFSYMPGVAHYLGDILVVGSKIFALITDVPRPIGEIVLGLHGMYIWGRVAVGAMLALGGRLGIVSANARQAYRDMTVLSAVRNPAFLPVAMLAAATGALIFMIGEAGHAQNSIQHLFGTMEEKLGTLPASEALIQLANDITTLQEKEKSLSLTNVDKLFGPTDFSSASIAGGFQKIGFALESAWGHLVNAITSPAHGGDLTKTLADVGDAFKSIFTSAGADSTAAVRDLQGFNQEIDKMVGSGRNLFAEAGKLMLAGHNFSDAFGIMNLAGVKWNDTAAVMQQKVNNLLTSYKEMSVQGGILRNSVQAVDFATLQQDSAVTKLTQGWTAFFGTLISGEDGFVKYVQSMQTFNAAADKVHGNIMGLSKAQIGARNDFLIAAQAAQTEMNNLTTMAASANLGAKGTNMLSQASKDMVANMLPAAKGSKALTAILYGLAQQGGYRGADSFRALSHWADNVKNPMKSLDKITTSLTVDMGDLLQDVKNLSVALGTTLTQAAAKAIFFASGGQKVFNAVAMSLIHDGANTRQFHDSLVPLASQLLITTGNTAKAHAMFDSFLMMMGENRSEADKLWASVVRLAKGISGLHDKSFTIFESGQGHYQIYGGTRPGATGGGAPGIPAAAKGLYISRGSHSKADDVLMWGSKGELMVPEEMVKAGLVDHLRGRIPGFSTGGYVGGISGLPGFTDRMTTSFQNQFTDAMINAMKKASVISFAAGGPGGGLPSRNAALAMAMFHPSPAEWSAWNYVAMAESGWNQFATNPSSGAYGIPQALPFTKMPPAAWPLWAGGASNPAAQIAWMWNYMWDAWGGPIGAAAHEAAYHWYGDGVDAIFKKRTLIGVGERGDEHVTVTPVGREHGQRVVLEFAPGAHGSFEAFMAEMIRKYVRVRGGNVQNVFGR